MGRMKRLVGLCLGTLAAMLVWAALVACGAREGWWQTMPAAKGDDAGFLTWAEGRYAAESKGNFAMVLLDRGHVAGAYFASHGRAIDGNSLFQVASISKWVTAWGVMRLVEQHRIDLDAPVSRYLTRWHLPPGEFDNNGVTVRRLLGHTAGLTDGLGFHGYAPGQTPLSIEQELTHAADAQPDASGIVRVGARPGNTWRYSGGGYLLLQLLIEEVTHEPFNDYMRRTVLVPLGMTESTFVDPAPAHLADVYDADGTQATQFKFTALSAASLYTSTSDMTRFLKAQIDSDKPPTRHFLDPVAREMMRQPQGYLFDIFPVWGLGEALYAPDIVGTYIIGHDGDNFPANNTTARIDPATGDGIVVFETGSSTLATEIGGEWVFWRTGTVGFDKLALFDAQGILIALASGTLLILLGAILIGGFGRRRAA